MKKPILITLCCASLILVTPLTGIAQENKISNNLSDKPDIDGLVAQIRTVVDEILQSYGHIPKVANLCGIILNLLGLIGRILLCITLIIMFIIFAILTLIFLKLGIKPLWQPFGILTLIDIEIYTSECYRYFNPLLKFIPTLKDIDDIANLAKDCPCLQE